MIVTALVHGEMDGDACGLSWCWTDEAHQILSRALRHIHTTHHMSVAGMIAPIANGRQVATVSNWTVGFVNTCVSYQQRWGCTSAFLST
jgi:hypothetical protein